jgi:hypothetical protein
MKNAGFPYSYVAVYQRVLNNPFAIVCYGSNCDFHVKQQLFYEPMQAIESHGHDLHSYNLG